MSLDCVGYAILNVDPCRRRFPPVAKSVVRRLPWVVEPLCSNPFGEMVRDTFRRVSFARVVRTLLIEEWTLTLRLHEFEKTVSYERGVKRYFALACRVL